MIYHDVCDAALNSSVCKNAAVAEDLVDGGGGVEDVGGHVE